MHSESWDQAREERNRYFREYRARHPEKTREANRRYWAKRAAKRAAETEGREACAENADN